MNIERPAAPRPEAHRWAVYFAPAPNSAWGEAGSRWLGRCAADGQPRPQPEVAGVAPALLQRVSAEPRRYGWHATLKAPFRLAPGASAQDLRAAVQAVAQRFAPFALHLQPGELGSFLALQPGPQERETVAAVAAACVEHLHRFAAPLTPAELARRRRAPLSAEQDALLQRWGYPHVMQCFRFHLSLTGPWTDIDPAERAALQVGAQRHFGELGPCRFDALALFAEPAPGADFRLVERFALNTQVPA